MNDIPDKGQLHKNAMLGERNTSQGDVKVEKYLRYYDVSHTITVARATDPSNQDDVAYNEERVHDSLQRNAPFLRVINDGIDNLFVIASHGGGQTFSPENIVRPGDTKDYINIYELRLRSPTAGLHYRVSEYNIYRGCCPTAGTITIPIQFPPIEKAVIHNTALPAVADTDFLITDITPTNTPCSFIVQIAVSITGIFRATIINEGNTQIVNFNQAIALTANSLYIFEMLVHDRDTVNFRYSTTGGTIQILRVQEADSAVI